MAADHGQTGGRAPELSHPHARRVSSFAFAFLCPGASGTNHVSEHGLASNFKRGFCWRCRARVKLKLCSFIFFPSIGRVAQLVEQCPFKAWVAGSSPAALTILFYELEIGTFGIWVQ